MVSSLNDVISHKSDCGTVTACRSITLLGRASIATENSAGASGVFEILKRSVVRAAEEVAIVEVCWKKRVWWTNKTKETRNEVFTRKL